MVVATSNLQTEDNKNEEKTIVFCQASLLYQQSIGLIYESKLIYHILLDFFNVKIGIKYVRCHQRQFQTSPLEHA